MLETFKLSQKIPLVILHRLVYKLGRKVAYLKSEFVKIGRFGAISMVFSIFFDLVAMNGRRGMMILHEGVGGA